jgi:hypothetical protein
MDNLSFVMPGRVPGIHVFVFWQDVDGRDKPGHGGAEMSGENVR